MEVILNIIILVLLFIFLEVRNLPIKSISLFIILLTIIYNLEYNKDKFDSLINKCTFIPEGKTRIACVDKCMAEHRPNYNVFCDTLNCSEMCDDCNTEDCLWKTPLDVPEPANIRGISGNGNAKITWISPYNHGNKITAYSLFIVDTVNSETVRSDFPPEINCEVCEYIISNLENNKEYQIYLISKNINGYSNKSNTINLVPTGNQSITSPMEGDNKSSKIVKLANETQNKFIKDFQDSNLINKLENKKGAVFRTNNFIFDIF